jgi:hypothetical protein
MQQLNRRPLAALGRNNYLLVSLTDALLKEDFKEEPLDSSNANNNNDNHSFVPTTFTTREEDKQTLHHVPNTTPQMHHDPTITSLCRLRLTWIEPAHQRGVVEDVDEDSLEDKPLKPPNRDTSLQEPDKQTSRTSFATNVAKQATTPETAPRGHRPEVQQQI